METPESAPAATDTAAGTGSTEGSVERSRDASGDTSVAARTDDRAKAEAPPESPTTKVRIDTPGVTVDIEAHETLGVVAATALRLFSEAGGWPQDRSRSAGFAQIERRETPPAQASSMEWAPGSYPVQMP
ncbi:MAG: hypothetical protein JXA67_14185 [Micromonosporaceae bacterium]|nr:hypothetical protein [Micromonosporaceae bacterium]